MTTLTQRLQAEAREKYENEVSCDAIMSPCGKEYIDITPEHWECIDTLIAHAVTEAQREERAKQGICEHEWIPCPSGICTSDLHTTHCRICGKHGMENPPCSTTLSALSPDKPTTT